MHDCLNLHGEFSRGFAFQRQSAESVSRREEGGSDASKALWLLSSASLGALQLLQP